MSLFPVFTQPRTAAQLASYVAVAFFLAMAIVQILIAIGLLPVTIVWGSSQTHHTVQNSLASVVACVILLGMAHVIYRRAQPLPSTSTKIMSVRTLYRQVYCFYLFESCACHTINSISLIPFSIHFSVDHYFLHGFSMWFSRMHECSYISRLVGGITHLTHISS
jgi:hypothetical protein